jgi:hypothetical protein
VGCKKSLETVQDLHKGLPTATRGIELLFGDIFEQDGKLEMARRIDAMRLAKDRISGRTSLTKRTLSAGVLIEEYEQHVQQQRVCGDSPKRGYPSADDSIHLDETASPG